MDSIILLLTILAMLVAVSFLAYDLFKMSKENKNPNKPKIKRWLYDELIVASFIATYYKTSNDRLIGYTALEMDREASSLVRKINRLRGIKTGKSPNASKRDITAINSFKDCSEFHAKYFLEDSLFELGIDSRAFHDLLYTSLKVNPIGNF